jgi:hypothetical protein
MPNPEPESPRKALLAHVRRELALTAPDSTCYQEALRALEVLARPSKLGPGHLPINQAERWQAALEILRGGR